MFETMLAKKYIASQKRHSALTVCSIAIALALIVMLFSMFSTGINILRSIAYSQGEYHIQITGVQDRWMTMEQYKVIEELASEYGSCTLDGVMGSGEVRPYANILFNKSIDSVNLFKNRIAEKLGVSWVNCDINKLLITLDMKDAESGLYMAAVIAVFYVFVLFLIMMLRLIIDTAFEISSKERERQFGVLQSIGATPKQIVRIMTYEGLMLSVIGIPLGTAAGIGLGYLVYRAVLGTGLVDLFLTQSKAAEIVHFSVSPWFLLLGVVTGAVWVLLSAYGTGMRVIKMSPVQAITKCANTVKKVSRAPLFGKLFGWTGKIASRNNMRRPKRFISTVVSLTLSIALFSAVTVAVKDLKIAAEDYYDDWGILGDFTIGFNYNFDDPSLSHLSKVRTIEESGLFEDIYFLFNTDCYIDFPENAENADTEKSERTRIRADVEFLGRRAYNEAFGGTPPISYDDLAKSGKYILSNELAGYLDPGQKITVTFEEDRLISYSEEEYNALPPEEYEKCRPIYKQNGEQYYGYSPSFTADFDIYCSADININERYITTSGQIDGRLIATVDQYQNSGYLLFKDKYKGVKCDYINCVLLNQDDYYKAVDLLEKNSVGYEDNTSDYRRLRALLASVNIIAVFLSVMIALIAVVNMINILATGILNRRGELAAMQCVGMTEKELYKMTAVECLQYALTSGIAAVAVCEIMMFFTGKMINIVLEEMEFLGNFISYIQPLPIIGIASLCAFIIAVAASIIPLRAMRKTPLVEQIRSVE